MLTAPDPSRIDRRHFLGRSLRGATAVSAVGALDLLASRGAAQTVPGVSDDAARFDVKAFGAVGDGRALDTAAINAAIAAAAQAGGGTVYFPPGVYLSASIHLQSNITLFLDAGSIIRAVSDQVATYDLPEPNPGGGNFQDYGHSHWQNSLIWGIGLENVSIIGLGLIHGEGLNPGFDRFADEANGVPRYRDGGPGSANKSIALRDCRNVVLKDFSILHGGHFGILATGVDTMLIENLKIDTNRDGMDIDCCQNVHVSRCSVNSPWDDGICLKASYALGRLVPCENITITDCYLSGNYDEGTLIDGTFKRSAPEYLSYKTGRIKLGTESNGDFRNIIVNNCIFDECRGLAIESVDGSNISEVVVTNVTMQQVSNCPIFICLGNRARGPVPTPVGTIRGVSISNVVAYDTAAECTICGLPGFPVEDITISDVQLGFHGGGQAGAAEIVPPENPAAYPEPGMYGPMPAYGAFIRHARNVSFENATFDTVQNEGRPAFVLEDVVGAQFSQMDVARNQAQSLLDLRHSGGVTLSNFATLTDVVIEPVVERQRI